jgi:hypothetical protein
MKAIKTEIVQTKSRGRCLIVSQRVPGGTCLLKEAPFHCIPTSSSTISTINMSSGIYQLSPIENDMLKVASSSLSCSNFEGSAIMLAARCLMKLSTSTINHRDKTLWNDLVDTEFEFDKQFRENRIQASKIVHRLVSISMTSITPVLCEKALLKLAHNTFHIVDSLNNECAKAVYLYSSTINHSCAPNAIHHFDDDGNIIITSLREILPNEEITISYLDIGKPKCWRQQELLKYGFYCSCSQCCCSDEEEEIAVSWCASDTNSLSHHTNDNCQGRLVPIQYSPHPYEQYSLWKEGKYPVIHWEDVYLFSACQDYHYPFASRMILFHHSYHPPRRIELQCSFCQRKEIKSVEELQKNYAQNIATKIDNHLQEIDRLLLFIDSTNPTTELSVDIQKDILNTINNHQQHDRLYQHVAFEVYIAQRLVTDYVDVLYKTLGKILDQLQSPSTISTSSTVSLLKLLEMYQHEYQQCIFWKHQSYPRFHVSMLICHLQYLTILTRMIWWMEEEQRNNNNNNNSSKQGQDEMNELWKCLQTSLQVFLQGLIPSKKNLSIHSSSQQQSIIAIQIISTIFSFSTVYLGSQNHWFRFGLKENCQYMITKLFD